MTKGSNNPLGKTIPFPTTFDPSLLYAIPRSASREALDLGSGLPFDGFDLWSCYELSWLNLQKCPRVGVLQFQVPCSSPALVESKSLKLFLGSLNSSQFESAAEVKKTIQKQLQVLLQTTLPFIEIFEPQDWSRLDGEASSGICIDDEPYQATSSSVQTISGSEIVHEHLTSHLLRSLCPVTGQPDWASVDIHYRGPAINRSSFLAFIVSLRQHQGFHEETCERIYLEIWNSLHPTELAVQCRYLRRGGIDITPMRYSKGLEKPPSIVRHIRQ